MSGRNRGPAAEGDGAAAPGENSADWLCPGACDTCGLLRDAARPEGDGVASAPSRSLSFTTTSFTWKAAMGVSP